MYAAVLDCANGYEKNIQEEINKVEEKRRQEVVSKAASEEKRRQEIVGKAASTETENA
jgi:hypothetical protein